MHKIVKKRLFVVLLCLMSLMALCFSLVACGDGDTMYKVTVANYDAEQGTVTLTPDAEGNEYKKDAEVTVEAHGKGDYAVDTFTVSTDANALLNSEGKYTFKVTADTTITVTFKSTAPATINVTDVALDHETLALEIGGLATKAEATLQATVNPTNATNKNVSWASDAEEIATVDQTGKVTAVAAGTANITVTTEDGGKTKTCVVTVAQHQHAAVAGADWQQDAETGKHYKVCECGERVEEGAHSAAVDATYTQAGTNHTYECAVCGTTVTESHEMSQDWSKNEVGHYYECVKCHSTEKPISHDTASATWTDKGEQGHSANCTVCGYEVVENHTLGNLTSVDATGHQQSCTANGCTYQTAKEGHTLEYVKTSQSYHWQECSDGCGYSTESEKVTHTWSVGYDDNQHWAKCDTCGFRYTNEGVSGVEAHTLSEWKVDDQGRHYKSCIDDSISGRTNLVCPYETTHEAHAAAEYNQGDENGHYKVCPTCGLHYAEDEHRYGSGTTCTECGYEKPECQHPAEKLEYTPNNDGTHKVHCTECDTDVNLNESCSYPLDEDGWYSGTGNCEHCGYQGVYEVTGTEISKYKGTFAKVKLPTSVLVADDAGGYTKSVSITGIATGTTKANPFISTPLTDVVIPTNITSIGNYAFAGALITSISVPDTVTSLGEYAFNKCTSLITATIGSGTTGLPKSLFANCSSLQKVTLNVQSGAFNTGALGACASLEQVILKNIPTSIPKSTFTGSKKAKLYFECSKAEYDSASPSILDTVVTQDKYYFYYATQSEAAAAKDSLTGFGGAWHYSNEDVEEYVLTNLVIGRGEVLLKKNFYEKGEKQC